MVARMFLDLGGTIRASSPSETLARLRPLLPGFGITRVMGQAGLGQINIPVSITCRPNSRFLSTSQGKGITRELADISAIMESIENFHAERVPPPAITASVMELRRAGRRFIHAASLTPLPGASFREDDAPIGWIELQHLASGETVLVPRTYLSMDTTQPRSESATRGLCVTTNGLASGNTVEEALVHAIYELIERDSLFEYERLSPDEQRSRRVDLTSVRGLNSHVDLLISLLEEAGMAMAIEAIHGKLEVPCFMARIGSKGTVDPIPGTGRGAHPVPEIALSRAITEAVQCRITYISGSRDDTFPRIYNRQGPVDSGQEPVEDMTCPLHMADVPRPPRFESFAETLRWTLARLERHGLTETCFFNHQRPEYGNVPVVSVVCPGLRMVIAEHMKAER
jgi:ribosomal protein S12 methylthiotransferase accessory factor